MWCKVPHPANPLQGIKKSFDYKKILKALKKEYCCNGTVVEDEELGQVIQVQGDQRKNVADFLTQVRTLTVRRHFWTTCAVTLTFESHCLHAEQDCQERSDQGTRFLIIGLAGGTVHAWLALGLACPGTRGGPARTSRSDLHYLLHASLLRPWMLQ